MAEANAVPVPLVAAMGAAPVRVRYANPAMQTWVWPIVVSVFIQVMGVVWMAATFAGQFQEFKNSVNYRLDRIERQMDAKRSPDGYRSPPIVSVHP